MRAAIWALALALSAAGCDDGESSACAGCLGGGDAGPPSSSLSLEWVEPPPAEAPAGEVLELTVAVGTPSGPAGALALNVTVTRGGGEAPALIETDGEGRATLPWTLGAAPVRNGVEVSVGPARLSAEVAGTRAAPLRSTDFGGVDAFMDAEGLAGSTEDLAFLGDSMVLGVPGGLLRVDAEGQVSRLALSGEPIDTPLGVAADEDGDLWVADSKAGRLLKVAADGAVSIALAEVDGAPLEGPNYVAIGPDGHVYLSDPCRGLLIRFDPTAAAVVATHAFDLASEGGPNGFAFDASGERLYVATENTVLLCGQPGLAAPDAALAGLFALEVTDGFGERAPIATELGVFGDGVAFDAEGNLYVVVDTVENLRLAESAVWVLPREQIREGGPLRKLLVAEDVVYANLAFGQGPFGATTLYLSLLAVPGFTSPDSRGVQKVTLGLEGLPLGF